MRDRIIILYCIIDDLIKCFGIDDDKRAKMSVSEVLTVALLAFLEFNGNYKKTLRILKKDYKAFFPDVLSLSRFLRRLNNLNPFIEPLFSVLSQVFKQLNAESVYLIDSLPIAFCDNIRISRCRLVADERFRGYIASKRRYFYGVKVHLIISPQQYIVEFSLSEGCLADCHALLTMPIDLPEGSTLIGDKGYNDYTIEEILAEAEKIQLTPLRKKNSKRADPPYISFLKQYQRKIIETVGSLIDHLIGGRIHAVTLSGFLLKLKIALMAYNFNRLIPVT